MVVSEFLSLAWLVTCSHQWSKNLEPPGSNWSEMCKTLFGAQFIWMSPVIAQTCRPQKHLLVYISTIPLAAIKLGQFASAGGLGFFCFYMLILKLDPLLGVNSALPGSLSPSSRYLLLPAAKQTVCAVPFIKPLPGSLENMISSSVLVHACAFLLQKQFPFQ